MPAPRTRRDRRLRGAGDRSSSRRSWGIPPVLLPGPSLDRTAVRQQIEGPGESGRSGFTAVVPRRADRRARRDPRLRVRSQPRPAHVGTRRPGSRSVRDLHGAARRRPYTAAVTVDASETGTVVARDDHGRDRRRADAARPRRAVAGALAKVTAQAFIGHGAWDQGGELRVRQGVPAVGPRLGHGHPRGQRLGRPRAGSRTAGTSSACRSPPERLAPRASGQASRRGYRCRPMGGIGGIGGRALSARLGRVGVWSFALQRLSAADEGAAIRELERLGYPAVWIPESVGSKEVFAHAAILLAGSERAIVAPGIASIYARDPMAMANGARALAEAYPGRFVLGIGVSHAPSVATRGGSYGKPIETMTEYLDGMANAAFAGPEPGEPVPLVLAALGPRMLELAAARADGAHPYFVPVEHTPMARAALGLGAVPRRRADGGPLDRRRRGPPHRPSVREALPRPAELRQQPAPARLVRRRHRERRQRSADRRGDRLGRRRRDRRSRARPTSTAAPITSASSSGSSPRPIRPSRATGSSRRLLALGLLARGSRSPEHRVPTRSPTIESAPSSSGVNQPNASVEPSTSSALRPTDDLHRVDEPNLVVAHRSARAARSPVCERIDRRSRDPCVEPRLLLDLPHGRGFGGLTELEAAARQDPQARAQVAGSDPARRSAAVAPDHAVGGERVSAGTGSARAASRAARGARRSPGRRVGRARRV